MIPLARIGLDTDLIGRLDTRKSQLVGAGASAQEARRIWRLARLEQLDLRQRLALMAAGLRRCMYCGDNLGTDIDHFDPISRTPLRTFDWPNHLLACSFCNSNQKRSRYPTDAAGNSLLVDPTRENPSVHLQLILSNGTFAGLTDKGRETIATFGLNRPDLKKGRTNAFHMRKAVLHYIKILIAESREDEAIRYTEALVEEPHASVFYEMLRTMKQPTASDVLGKDVVAVMSDPAVHQLILLAWHIPVQGEIAPLTTLKPVVSSTLEPENT